MQSHNLIRNASNRKARQVGRGSKRGKTSGRGTKGQKARAGHKIRPALRDIIKKLPKRRGRGIHPNKVIGAKASPVNLGLIEKIFENGAIITPQVLSEKGLVRNVHGRVPSIKILGSGEISKAINIERCAVSASARKKIETAGGKIN